MRILVEIGAPTLLYRFRPTEEELFPAWAVLPRAREIFPKLALAEFLESCRHVPSKAALGRVNERVLTFIAGLK